MNNGKRGGDKNMKTSEKAQVILRLVKREALQVFHESIKDQANLEATVAGHNKFKELNPDDGAGEPFSSNPYNVESAASRQESSSRNWDNYRQVLEFAEDTFLSMIEDKYEKK